jgi:hypothetical protein
MIVPGGAMASRYLKSLSTALFVAAGSALFAPYFGTAQETGCLSKRVADWGYAAGRIGTSGTPSAPIVGQHGLRIAELQESDMPEAEKCAEVDGMIAELKAFAPKLFAPEDEAAGCSYQVLEDKMRRYSEWKWDAESRRAPAADKAKLKEIVESGIDQRILDAYSDATENPWDPNPDKRKVHCDLVDDTVARYNIPELPE